MDLHRKTIVNHIVIAFGIIIAGFIILGFFKTIRLVNSWGSDPAAPRCSECITVDHNNTQRVLKSGVEIVIELPSNRYPVENLVVISDPAEIIEIYDAKARKTGNWARTLNLVAPGTAEIIVSSANSAIPDYKLNLTIE